MIVVQYLTQRYYTYKSVLVSVDYCYHNCGLKNYHFPHSLYGNSIGDEGAVAIAESMKTMTSLQVLE